MEGRHPKAFESIDWPRLFELLELNSATTERLMRLLTVHMLVDRVLTSALAVRLTQDQTQIEGAIGKLAELGFAQRIDLAKLCGAISGETPAELQEVNRVRNAFAHYKPKHGWSPGDIPELADEARYTACAAGGIRALQTLVAALGNEGGR